MGMIRNVPPPPGAGVRRPASPNFHPDPRFVDGVRALALWKGTSPIGWATDLELATLICPAASIAMWMDYHPEGGIFTGFDRDQPIYSKCGHEWCRIVRLTWELYAEMVDWVESLDEEPPYEETTRLMTNFSDRLLSLRAAFRRVSDSDNDMGFAARFDQIQNSIRGVFEAIEPKPGRPYKTG